MAQLPTDPRYVKLLKSQPIMWYGDRRGEYFLYRVISHLGVILWESSLLTFGELRSFPGKFFPGASLYDTRSTLTYYVFGPMKSFQSTIRVRRITKPSGSGFMLFLYPSDDSYRAYVDKLRALSRRSIKSPSAGWKSSSRSSQRKNPETRYETRTLRHWTSTGIDSTTPYTFNVYNRTWSGTRTPNFQKLVAEGRRLPINAHSVSIIEKRYGDCLMNTNAYTGAWDIKVFPWYTFWPEPPGATHLSNVGNVALRRLISRAESGMSGNLALGMVQIGQVTRMIATTVMRLTKAIRAVKQGNLTKAAAFLYDPLHRMPNRRREPRPGLPLARNWLELQYGWKPLLSDLRGTMEATARMNLADLHVRTVKSSATRNTTQRIPFQVPNLSGTPWAGVHILHTFTQFRYGIRFALDDPLTAFLAQTGFTNPINLAWEIIPYSFVVDWFLPIGPYLETLSAWKGMHFVDGFQTQFTRQDAYSVVYFDGYLANPPNWSKNKTYGTYARESVLLNRGKLTSFPTASFPEFKNPLSVGHALNGLALLRAAFVPRGQRGYRL